MEEELNIRLRYSSFVNYAGMIYRLIIAVGFVILIARKLSVAEFGLWGIILSSSIMLASISNLWNFWLQRYLGRGVKEAFGSAVLITLGYIIFGSGIYVLLAYSEYRALGWGISYLYLGLMLFIFSVIDALISSALSVIKPEGIGYKRFIYETLRLALAYYLMINLKMGLYGVIIGVSLALMFGSSYGAYLIAKTRAITLNFSKKLIQQWFKSIYIPSMDILNSFLYSGLRVFVAWITGSDVPVAYLNVGLSSQSPMLSAAYAVSPALYARALRKPRGKDLTEVLRIYLLVTGYLATTFIVLSKPIVTLYNPKYLSAYTVLIIISLYALILGVANIYKTALMGYERVDIEKGLAFKALLHSYLFKAPLVSLISISLAYIAGSGAVVLANSANCYILVAELASAGLLAGSLLMLPYFLMETGKVLPYSFPFKELTISLFGGLLTAFFYWITRINNIIVRSFWKDGTILGVGILLGVIIYLLPWISASKWLRELIRKGLKELKLKI